MVLRADLVVVTTILNWPEGFIESSQYSSSSRWIYELRSSHDLVVVTTTLQFWKSRVWYFFSCISEYCIANDFETDRLYVTLNVARKKLYKKLYEVIFRIKVNEKQCWQNHQFCCFEKFMVLLTLTFIYFELNHDPIYLFISFFKSYIWRDIQII